MVILWVQFVIFSAVIIYAGIRLSFLGDKMADKTGWGRTFIGVAFLAFATSLPEVTTSLAAVSINAVDIAVGNLLGSNGFNLFIAGFVFLFVKRFFGTPKSRSSHIVSGSMGILLAALVGGAILVHHLSAELIPSLGWVGVESLILFGGYLLGMRIIFREEQRLLSEEPLTAAEVPASSGALFSRFAFYTAAILISGIRLAQIGGVIAKLPLSFLGRKVVLGQTVVGFLLIAVVTSLPELVVSITSLRIGAYDMAVGNLLGSNMFNLMIFSLADVIYPKSSVFASTGLGSLGIVALVIAMTAVVMLGSALPGDRRRFKLEGFTIILLYLVGIFILMRLNLTIR
jgi:cation:H+ antiporter